MTSVSENGYFVSGLGAEPSRTNPIYNISFVNVHAVIQQLPSNNASNGPHTAHDDTTGGRIAAPVDAFFVEHASGVSFESCSAAFSGEPTDGNAFGRWCASVPSDRGGHSCSCLTVERCFLL